MFRDLAHCHLAVNARPGSRLSTQTTEIAKHLLYKTLIIYDSRLYCSLIKSKLISFFINLNRRYRLLSAIYSFVDMQKIYYVRTY